MSEVEIFEYKRAEIKFIMNYSSKLLSVPDNAHFLEQVLFRKLCFLQSLSTRPMVQVSTVGYFVNSMFYVLFLVGAEDFQVGGNQ